MLVNKKYLIDSKTANNAISSHNNLYIMTTFQTLFLRKSHIKKSKIIKNNFSIKSDEVVHLDTDQSDL